MGKILTFFLLQAQGRTDSELELKLKRVRKRTGGRRADLMEKILMFCKLELKRVRKQTGGRQMDGFLKGEEDRPCQRPWRCVASLVCQIWGGAMRKTGQAGQEKM
jgi:hypothetical protein